MTETVSNLYAVLLAGGTGTRLWPVSRRLFPKQLVKFTGEYSLIQSTIKRLDALIDAENIRIVCGQAHVHEMARHIRELGIDPDGKLIPEPAGRNTAPAILLAAMLIARDEPDAVLGVFPADHVISHLERFHAALQSAIRLAQEGFVVTFGIRPTYPETGYGYIEGGEVIDGPQGRDRARRLVRFVEKPDAKTAAEYLKSGNFFWNSGMFAFRASVIIDEFGRHAPALLAGMKRALDQGRVPDPAAYKELQNISIDYAIMENTAKGVLVPSDFGWSDIGSWKSLYDFLPKDEKANVIIGDVVPKDTTASLVMSHERIIATNKISNLAVVETADAIFVSDLQDSREVKKIVEELKEKKRPESDAHAECSFSWGSARLLAQENERFSIRRIRILPGAVFLFEPNPDRMRHIIVLQGDLTLCAQNGTHPLEKGAFHLLAAQMEARLENGTSQTAEAVIIEMK